jgi:integrase
VGSGDGGGDRKIQARGKEGNQDGEKTMTTLRLKFVQAWVDHEGRAHHYFRRAGYARVRLPGLPGSPEFMRAYETALGSTPEPVGIARTKAGSVAAAIASYYGSAAFTKLAPETQGVRRAVLDAFKREHGDKLIRAMPSKFIRALLDAMEPTTAKNWLAAIRAMAQHCIKVDMLDDDPTLGVKLARRAGDGIHTWTEEQIARFETRHAIGSRERLALALGLYTAQRRGDVVRMGRQHVRGDVLHVKQEKTGKELAIPLHPELRQILATVPATTQLTFLRTLRGKPFDPHAFSAWFGEARDVAGLPSACTFHGLRKAACRRLAEAGCTVHEIAAISGHASLREVERYTKAADQMKLARAAMARATAAEQSGTQTVKSDSGQVSKPLPALEKKPA